MSTQSERTDAIAAQVHALDETLRAMDEPTPPLWKKTLVIGGDNDWTEEITLKEAYNNLGARVLILLNSDGEYISPSDAARAALWLASYANDHGCPVSLPVSEPRPCA